MWKGLECVRSLLWYLELEFLLGCYRGFRAVAGVLVAAFRDEVDRRSQAVDGQLVAVPQFIVTFCESTWRWVECKLWLKPTVKLKNNTLDFTDWLKNICFCVFSVLTMWQCDTGSVHYSLGKLVVVAFQCHGGCFQGIPDLLTALEGRRCVPELISLAT